MAAFGMNSYSYTFGLTAAQFLTRLAARGYGSFELMIYPGHLWPKAMTTADRSALRRHAESLGVRVVTLNMPNIDVNIAAASEDMRALSLDHLSRIVQLAGDLGVPGVIIGPGKSNPLFPMPREALMGHFLTALETLVPLAQKAGTRIVVENMPFAFLPGIDELMAALDRFGSPDVQIVYDVANGHFIKEDIVAGLRKAAPRLALVHLSDTGLSTYRHDAVGLGTVPFHVVPPVLEELGHREPPMLEIIAADADAQIDDSARRLTAAGFK
ncbi:MAG: sugar phosphate isomerase/epimerase family protein [Hyphomicrobiaceae bacterium]